MNNSFIDRLDALLLDATLPASDADIVRTVRKMILSSVPIPADIQEGMVRILANQSTPDKYGKLKGE